MLELYISPFIVNEFRRVLQEKFGLDKPDSPLKQYQGVKIHSPAEFLRLGLNRY